LARVLLADSLRGANWPGSEKAVNHKTLTGTVILKDDGTDDGTARSVIRPMGGRRAGLITAGAVPSSVPSCLQRNMQRSRC